MNQYAYMSAAALGLALAAGSAQAGSKLGLGSDGRTGRHLDGGSAGGVADEAAEMSGDDIQLNHRSGTLMLTSGGRSGRR